MPPTPPSEVATQDHQMWLFCSHTTVGIQACGNMDNTYLLMGFRHVGTWIIHLYLYIFIDIFINKYIYFYVWIGRVPLWEPSTHLDFNPDMIVGIRFGVWDRSKTTSYIRNMWTSCAPNGDVTDYSTVPLMPECTSLSLSWSHNSHWSTSTECTFYSLFLKRFWSFCFCFLGTLCRVPI